MKFIVAGTLAALAFAGSTTASSSNQRPDLITVLVTEAGTSRGVVHPMVCIREFNHPIGPIGDSSGTVAFGGSLPAGVLHLRIMAPDFVSLDTTAVWPPSPTSSEMRVALKRKAGPPSEPECPTKR